MSAMDDVSKTVGTILGIPVTETTAREIEPKWDSLKHIEIMFSVEDICGIRFSQDQLANLSTVSDIAKAVEEIRES